MTRPTKSLLAWLGQRGADEPSTPARHTAPVALAGGTGWRLVAAEFGLSLAAVSAPIAVTAVPAASGLLGPPLVANALVALLVLVPAGVGLATVLSGLRRATAAISKRGDSEAEQAVLRVLVDVLIFFSALGLAVGSPYTGPPPYLAVAAFALVVAWALLLEIILWPATQRLRRFGSVTLDIVLFSAFLHCGGGAVAGWYPLYLLAILYAGFRFGLGALWGTAALSILCFAAVVLTTDVWRQQPALAAGLVLALAVLPGFITGAMRAIVSAQVAGAEVEANRQQILLIIADNLRGPLATIGAALALGGRSAALRQPDEPALTAHAVRVLASQINDVRDLAALEAGAFAPPVEVFDLRALVARSLTPLQAAAADNGIALRWRVDPHLPVRLRGRAQALASILASLAGHAVEAAASGPVRIALDAAAGDARRLQLRLVTETPGIDGEPDPAPAEGPLTLLLVRRLVALMGGAFAAERTPAQRIRLTVTLVLAIEEGAAEPVLDLGQRLVLIATDDEDFAGTLAALLAAWNADARWVSDADSALAALAEGPRMIPVLIIDGSRKLLSALSLAHRAAGTGPAPFVLLVADPGQIERLGEVDEGEVDSFIPMPLSKQLLANALYALPLAPPMADSPTPHEPMPHTNERITPIASHPKFAPESAAALDRRAIDGLRELGGDPAFLGELVETFQTDAQQIMERLDHAVASADADGFARSLGALRRAASPLGGTQLCELLASFQGLTAGELRQLGASHVRRLDAEIERLAAALTEIAAATEARLH